MLDGFLQLHNGAFFMLSAFGNWFSIRRGMDRAEAKNPGNPDYKPVVRTILIRGALIMSLGMFASFFLQSDLFGTFIGVGNGGRGSFDGHWADTMASRFESGWKGGLLSPAVTPYIGFTGIIAFNVEKRCGPETSDRKTKTMAVAFVSVFVVGFVFRRSLDLLTTPGVGGQKCHSWNITELQYADIHMPGQCVTTHAPKLDFSDVELSKWPGKRPSAHGSQNISCPDSVNTDDLTCPHGALDSSGQWVDTGAAESYARAIDAGCLRGYPSHLS